MNSIPFTMKTSIQSYPNQPVLLGLIPFRYGSVRAEPPTPLKFSVPGSALEHVKKSLWVGKVPLLQRGGLRGTFPSLRGTLVFTCSYPALTTSCVSLNRAAGEKRTPGQRFWSPRRSPLRDVLLRVPTLRSSPAHPVTPLPHPGRGFDPRPRQPFLCSAGCDFPRPRRLAW